MNAIRKNGIPKYIQLKDILIDEIRSGRYQPGDKFYTEKELMQKYNLSYATITHAIRDMAKEGHFIRKKSLGTFITEYGIGNRAEHDIITDPLYINDISDLCDKAKTPLSWHTYDQLQKGIINTYNGPVKIIPYEEILNKENINAIIINPENIQEAQSAKCKYIIINLHHDVKLDFNSVTRDVLIGVYNLMSYLIGELGHDKIGFIGGNTIKYHSNLYAGYEIALRTYFLPYNKDYVVRGLLGTEKDGYDAMKKLLSLPNPPTAVFADTDIKAYGAIKAAQETGLKIPEDISIAGFGDTVESRNFSPPLTTVNVPFYDMGKRAVELLLERIRNNNDIKTEVQENSLILRESCAKTNNHKTNPVGDWK